MPAAPTVHSVKRCRPQLGTFVEITLSGRQSETALHKAADKAFEMIGCVQSLMSFHDSASEVSRLNQCGHLAPLAVHPWTWRVLAAALELSRETDGIFDISIAPHLIRSGYLPRHGPVRTYRQAGRWEDIRLLDGNRVIFDQPLMLDLGGIAKGFAIDKAADYLETCGLTSAVVNAGGDLRVIGTPPASVGLRDPAAPRGNFLPAAMLRRALATSATYFSRKKRAGVEVSPIVHPRSGKPVRNGTSVSVFAPTCMEADALTKAVLLAGQSVWKRLLTARDAVALLLTPRGEQILYPA